MECIYNCTQAVAGINWPAWIQAVGSLVAVGVAAYIPIRLASEERKRTARERRYRARSLAFVIRPLLRSSANGVALMRARWRESPIRMEEDSAMDPLKIPQGLAELLLDLHVLGAAGTYIQKAIVSIQELEAGIHTQVGHLRYGGVWVHHETGEEFPIPDTDVEALMDDAMEAINSAIRLLDGLLD